MPNYHEITITKDEDTELSLMAAQSESWHPDRTDYDPDWLHEHVLLLGTDERKIVHMHDTPGSHKHTVNGPMAVLAGF